MFSQVVDCSRRPGDRRRYPSMRFTFLRIFTIALIAASPATLRGDDCNATEIANELIHWLSLSQSDGDRENAIPLSNVDIECLPYEEQIALVSIAIPMLNKLKRNAADSNFGMAPNRLVLARADVLHLQFHIDERIAPRDAERIAESIADNPLVDPRVIRFGFVDSKTVSVTTGVTEGPLAGSGSVYVARLENGVWVVRFSSHWLS
ncbi:hypothetical protein LOC71_04975 [Rhodopirellula sp. JC740]|uniref:Uncharacterized protein n=1 Tax=Rhodopirellula halodulae TaxID=2894198 RepID=A0ABS8NFB0_9BACT|nr:hypothetical protein [Rhodopirellula sp. JC740]MCC9641617.1 hypothetical protein [Rhodopirellula sp. JC740]